jgi:hypothetical protein
LPVANQILQSLFIELQDSGVLQWFNIEQLFVLYAYLVKFADIL